LLSQLQTPEEKAEAAIHEATLDYAVINGRLVASPKGGRLTGMDLAPALASACLTAASMHSLRSRHSRSPSHAAVEGISKLAHLNGELT